MEMMRMAQQGKQTEILLESGTNEFEIMEFTIAGQVFGINVAKVTEIMTYIPLKPMQNAQPNIEGIFKPRDKVITVIDLAKYLHLPPSEDNSHDIFIITNFNQLQFGFHVHTVVGIDRVSWKKIQKPDKIIYGGEDGVATGIAEYENRLISILDFEKIVSEINPEVSVQVSKVEGLAERERTDLPILIAEDSMLLSKLIVESLHKAGYSNIIKTDNGQEAWDYLNEAKVSGDPITNHVACVVTDIEMPQMDGHRLTKLIKDDSVLKAIPVVVFSSLIDEAMYVKGKSIGANEQITKPEIANLVSIIDRLTNAYTPEK
jgi:two-component system chemotaxis response regulator CheV